MRIKGEPLTVASDEGVREVITLHLNAQLVRQQSCNTVPPMSTVWPPLGAPCSRLPNSPGDWWNRAHVTNDLSIHVVRHLQSRYPPTIVVQWFPCIMWLTRSEMGSRNSREAVEQI